VFLYRQRPCDELITRPRSPTDCHRSRNWNFHGGGKGLNLAVEPGGGEFLISCLIIQVFCEPVQSADQMFCQLVNKLVYWLVNYYVNYSDIFAYVPDFKVTKHNIMYIL
jgi:hypothetical protein